MSKTLCEAINEMHSLFKRVPEIFRPVILKSLSEEITVTETERSIPTVTDSNGRRVGAKPTTSLKVFALIKERGGSISAAELATDLGVTYSRAHNQLDSMIRNKTLRKHSRGVYVLYGDVTPRVVALPPARPKAVLPSLSEGHLQGRASAAWREVFATSGSTEEVKAFSQWLKDNNLPQQANNHHLLGYKRSLAK
jgi:hypothetical protein